MPDRHKQIVMTLQQYFQAYEFDEVFPYVGLMYQPARHQRAAFSRAYDILRELKPVLSKKQIRYELMQDPDSKEIFCGADDSCFASPWDVLLGKTVKKESGVDLTDDEIVTNCLLNVVLIGRCPRQFEADRQRILSAK